MGGVGRALAAWRSGLMIALLEKLGVVWNVVRVSPERQAAKALPTPPKTGGVTA